VLDQLETILRHVADELATWRARALKAETELKETGAGKGTLVAKLDPEIRGRVSDLEQENKTLRQRVEVARGRVHDLVSRLTFLEEQAREPAGNGGGRGSGAAPRGPAAGSSGVGGIGGGAGPSGSEGGGGGGASA
jgi:cell division protein FtsB